jgi:RES domain-containing protein
MIVTDLDGSLPFFRAHTPKWASAPLSGAGAASVGGRLNRPGVHALYLASTHQTAIAEYQQAEPLMPPCTLVTYHVRLHSVVDFRAGFVPGLWDSLWQELGCNWRGLAMLDGIDPPSWDLGDRVLEAGHCGILYPSQRATGTNLVVYTDALRPPNVLEVFDPGETLPRDQSSWPSNK